MCLGMCLVGNKNLVVGWKYWVKEMGGVRWKNWLIF